MAVIHKRVKGLAYVETGGFSPGQLAINPPRCARLFPSILAAMQFGHQIRIFGSSATRYNARKVIDELH